MGELHLGYTESQGNPILRQAIAKHYSTVDADDVVMVVPEEGIFVALHTLLDAGDEVIVLTPAYDSLRHLTTHIAGKGLL